MQATVEPAWAGAPVTIVYGPDGAVLPQTCGLYATHSCAILQAHHVIPESWWRAAGKPVASPMKNLCPNCHMNVHAAIDALIHTPPRDTSHLPPRAAALAAQGIAGAAEAGLTPAPTL